MIPARARSLTQQKTFRQASRYLWMTLLSAGLTLTLPVLLHEVFALGKEIAVALALATTFFVNFITVRVIVFRSIGNMTSEFVRYVVTNASFRIAEYLLFLLMSTVLDYNYIFILGAVLVLSFILKFILYRIFVFSQPASEPDEVPRPTQWG
jgi:putative flippase GtrA